MDLDFYHLAGMTNSLFVLVSLLGVMSQLKKVWNRKKQGEREATELLSLNQFFVSFLAYLAFFVYGYSIEPFNHYMVWTRLLAALLVATIVFEIAVARRKKKETTAFVVTIAFLISGVVGLFVADRVVDEGKLIATSLMLGVSILLAQGYWSQIKLIIQSGQTGAVDLRMSQFILMMDLSTILFVFAIGLKEGWPMLCIALVSGTTKLIIMYLFYWVRVSPGAELKRQVTS